MCGGSSWQPEHTAGPESWNRVSTLHIAFECATRSLRRPLLNVYRMGCGDRLRTTQSPGHRATGGRTTNKGHCKGGAKTTSF